MIGRLNLSGGLDINGIIEEYKVYSGGNVSAGDFVSFINELEETLGGNIITPGTDNKVQNTAFLGATISAVQLTDTKIFIAHTYSSSNYYLYGIVININADGTLSVGTDTLISNTKYSGLAISAVQLTDTKVFIAHSYSASKYLYGIVINIANDTITVGTDTQLSSTSQSGGGIVTTKLNSNKVLIAHNTFTNASEALLWGMVVNISNESVITHGSDTNLINGADCMGNKIAITTLTDTKVFIAFSYASESTSYYLEGEVLEISNNTITVFNYRQISFMDDPGRNISVVSMNASKVFIAYNYENTNRGLEVAILNINNDNTISVARRTVISTVKNSGNIFNTIKLDVNNIFIAHSYSNNMNLYGMIVNIANDIITIGLDTQLSSVASTGNVISSVVCSTKVYIAHNQGTSTSNSYLYLIPASIESYVTNIKTLSSTDELIRGVAKKSGNSGNTIDVFVPDVN